MPMHFQYVNTLFPAMIEFDPTEQENRQNDQWNRVEQTLKSKSLHLSSVFFDEFH